MNTIKSTWLGWGTLCLAGGGAYFFAKRHVNADRKARHEADMKRQARYQKLQPLVSTDGSPKTKTKKANRSDEKGLDYAGSPSAEASQDAAPVRHAPEMERERISERSKYEAPVPYRSRKGDRLS